MKKKEKIESKHKDNPRLEQRVMNDGRISLYLEYYFGYSREQVFDEHGEPARYESGKMAGQLKYRYKHDRRKENLEGLYLIAKPRTPIEKQRNKQIQEKAEEIRAEREQQLLNDKQGYRLTMENRNILIYWEEFIEETNVADKRLLKAALRSFKDFIIEEYPVFTVRNMEGVKEARIEAKQLRPDMMRKFVDYLIDNHKGQGAMTYFKRFKRLINYSLSTGMLKQNPCKDSQGKAIAPPTTDDILAKDILSADELVQLFSTHYEGENPEIRRAFAMTCYSGIRFCDIVKLSYSDIDYSNRVLTFRQSKTAAHSSRSGVNIPLNDTLLSIVGVKADDADDDFIFHLPSSTMCLKALRRWTKRAGINKHITWHCGRHSFATMILTNGANVKVVSSLLGHSSLRFTEVYVRAMDEAKKKAIDSMPTLEVKNI